MRIVLTGTTGVEKTAVARAVASLAARERGLPPDLNDPLTKKFIQVFDVEQDIKRELGGDIRPYLDHFVPRERREYWRQAASAILDSAAAVEHCILSFHNLLYRSSIFSDVIDWSLLLRYQPTLFVTLIDDVYDVWQRVVDREDKFRTNTFLNLSELLAWRTAEISATATLAQNLYSRGSSLALSTAEVRSLVSGHPAAADLFGPAIPHLVFAVKHSASTLHRLLFHRDLLPVYASFPITKPRGELDKGDPTGQAEINAFRRRLYEADFLAVVDPVTIDELRFRSDWKPGQPALRERWAIDVYPAMVESPLDTGVDPFQGFDQLQFDTFVDTIGKHVEERDYRLVSQAATVAAYRPYYGGPLGSGKAPSPGPSGGVEHELLASRVFNKTTYVVHPQQDRTGGPPVFREIDHAVKVENIDQLLEELKKRQERWKQALTERGGQTTWERAI